MRHIHRFNTLCGIVCAFMIIGCDEEVKFRGGKAEAIRNGTSVANQTAIAPPSEPVVVEVPEKLQIKAFIGADFVSADACKTAPTTHNNVATKLLPIDFCLTGTSAHFSTTKLCVLVNDTETIPAADHACWQARDELEKIVLLSQGENYVRIFARDAEGNMASDGGVVNMNQGKPPFIDILLPEITDLAYKPWKPGETHKIKWRVTDDDTKFADLRVFISLIDPKNKNVFKHIACNFKNSSAWKQCPDASIENSPLISGNASTNTFELNLQVPPEFDESKRYVVAISAIDQSGNASIASTQEVNAGVEVLAGRSYKGLGGSGVTVQPESTRSKVFVDNRKSIYLPASNIKIDPFDSRTCRMFRSSPADLTPYDCRDAFAHSFTTISQAWVYNPSDDVFYAQATRVEGATQVPYIVKIDFNARRVESVFGGLGKRELTDLVASGAAAENFTSSAIGSNMWFDKTNRLLIFKASNQLYSLDHANKLNYILGSRDLNAYPADQFNVKQSQIIIPHGDQAFAISNDGRIIFSGLLPADAPVGAGYGLQYIMTGFNPASKDAIVSLRIMPYDTTKNRANYAYSNSIDYDAKSNSFFASLAWWGFARMNLPSAAADIGAYQWDYLTKEQTGSNRSLLDQLIGDETSDGKLVASPRLSSHYAYALVYAGANTLYLSESKNGIIFSYDLASNRMSRLVGFDIGNENTQLGINRRLDDPRSPIFDNQKNLLFNDLFNLQRINLSAGQSTPEVETLVSGFGFEPFVYNSASSEVLQVKSHNNLAVYNYNNLSLAPKTFRAPTVGNGYYIQYGFSNNLANLKTIIHNTTWDGLQVKNSVMRVNDFGARHTWPAAGGVVAAIQTLMSPADLMGVDYPGCGGSNAACRNTGNDQNIYEASTFRQQRIGASQESHDGGNRIAFMANDQSYVACVIDPKSGKPRFGEFDVASKKVYVFAAMTTPGTEIACGILLGQFHQYNGTMYYAIDSQVYALDMSRVRTSANAVATPVPVNGAFSATRFGGLLVDDSYVYYTDLETDRVLRNKRK